LSTKLKSPLTTTAEGKQSIQVEGGVVEIKQNTIVVLAEKVVDPY